MPRQSVYTPLSELASLDYNYWYIIMVVTFRQSCRRGKRRKEKEKTAAMINTEIAATKEEENAQRMMLPRQVRSRPVW
jgi:hypothetical protein